MLKPCSILGYQNFRLMGWQCCLLVEINYYSPEFPPEIALLAPEAVVELVGLFVVADDVLVVFPAVEEDFFAGFI